MVRINLLPTEILERRKYERYYPYVFVGAGLALLVVVVVWVIAQYNVTQRNREIQQTQQNAATLQAEANNLAVFEQRGQELEARQLTVVSALGGRVSMGKLMEEISLVLPDPIWVDKMRLDQGEGLTLAGRTPYDKDHPKLGNGFKSIASALVRLNSLDGFTDVWLTQAVIETFEEYQGVTFTPSPDDVVTFEATAKISLPPTNTVTPASSTPPSTPQGK